MEWVEDGQNGCVGEEGNVVGYLMDGGKNWPLEMVRTGLLGVDAPDNIGAVL